MKSIIERLVTSQGLRGAAVFDAEGGCVATAGTAGAIAALQPLARFFRGDDAEAGAAAIVARARATIVRGARATLVVRRSEGVTLVVLGDPGLDMTRSGAGFHISVAAKVLAMRSRSVRPAPRESHVVPAGEVALDPLPIAKS